MLQQVFSLFFTTCLVVVELDDNHQFTAGTIADNDIPQESYLCTQVEERDAMRYGVVANVVTYLIVQVVHQPALLNGQYLVEGSCDMEADGGRVLYQCFVLQLFAGQPAFISTTEV